LGEERKAVDFVFQAGISIIKDNMKIIRYILLIFSAFAFLATNAQNAKKMREQYQNARDSSQGNYVIFKTDPGKKQPISGIDFPGVKSFQGKVELANGEKIKFKTGEIVECQTKDAFYKICQYIYDESDAIGGVLVGTDLAKREFRGKINIYSLSVSYSRAFSEPGKMNLAYTYFYLVEANDDGRLIVLKNDTAVVNKVEHLVANSVSAMEVINKIRSKYGKIKEKSFVELNLLDAVKLYNKDVAEGKIEK
jgi:hypothetical protein